MGGRGSGGFSPAELSLTGILPNGKISPLITAGLTELRGNEADTESTLKRIDIVRFNGLKHEQLFVVDRDGFVLTGYDGGRSSVAFPPEKAAEWKNYIVTHRHPDSFGGTFSPADLSCMTRFGWSEMEASANEGRYNIKRLRGADDAGVMRQLQAEIGTLEQRMVKIAQEMSRRQGEFSSRQQFVYENRRQQVKVFDDWYRANLPKYGFTYKFTARELNEDDR